MNTVLIACLSLTLAGGVAAADPSGAPQASADSALRALADDYFDHCYFPSNPTSATLEGIHRYDSQLEDFSRSSIDAQSRALHGFEDRFEALSVAPLSEQARGDRELLLGSIRSQLLTLETIRPWEKDPDSYPAAITQSAFAIMQREFAPADDRLRSLIAREQQMPAALAAAKINLRNPPRIFTQIALEQLPGMVSFFETDLPSAFSGADDASLQQRFRRSNDQVIASLQQYQTWLQQQLLPRSHGEFRLGAATFRAKLADDEMVDTPLERLLAIGLRDLQRNRAQFARVAHQLEPHKTARQVLEQLAADQPPPAQLLASFQATFDGLTNFLRDHPIITIPSQERPMLRETPPFMRATTFASMDTPGPFETVGREAYFNVTLPDSSWDAKRIHGFMAQFNRSIISNVVVHEAYPGHYIQFLWMHRIDDRVRQVIGAASNSEGWAHYCEQMMLDEGYGQPGTGASDARGALRLRLGQLQAALLRDARYVVAIRMHTAGMSMAQAIDFFVREGYQSREVGEVETKRGTSDPTYLYYTLGKLQIQKMRADLQARQGAAFSLKAFHDAYMQQGEPPIKIVRRALLQDDSPPL